MRKLDKTIQISCDGGAATGKSTGAKLISKKFRLNFLSSGLLYRYAGYLLLKNNPKNGTSFLRKKFQNFNYNKIKKINLHSPTISKFSSSNCSVIQSYVALLLITIWIGPTFKTAVSPIQPTRPSQIPPR